MNYTGSDCLEQLRNSSFSWRYLAPDSPSDRNTPLDLSQQSDLSITRNEENQVQPSKSSCLLPSPPVARGRRARTKRRRRLVFSPRRLIPAMSEPKNPSTSLITKQRKKMTQLRLSDPIEKNNGSTKCTHCGVTDTPQWRAGPLGPRTLCNACGVRYKSGRLLPEYRPAASPYFSPTLHSNSHKKVLQIRNKVDHGTELATELASVEKVHPMRNNPVHEFYNEETTDNTPVTSSESEFIQSIGSSSHESVLQMRDDEDFYGYEIDADKSMELIPNIDPLYGLDLSEYILGNHALDFTF